MSRSNPEDVAPACKATVGRGVPNSRGQLDSPETRQQELGSPSSVPLSWPGHSWHPSALPGTFLTWARARHSQTGSRSLGWWVNGRREREAAVKHRQLWAGGMLMFWDLFPGLGLLWGHCGWWGRMQWGLRRGFAVRGVLLTLADPEFVRGGRNVIQDSEQGGRSGSRWGYSCLRCGASCSEPVPYSGAWQGSRLFCIPSIPGERGSSWVTCGSPLPLAVTPFLFHRDPGQAFSRHARRRLQLSQRPKLCRAARDSHSGCQQGWPRQPSSLTAGAVP